MLLSMLVRESEWVSAVEEGIENPNIIEVVLPGLKMVVLNEAMLKDTVITNGAADEC